MGLKLQTAPQATRAGASLTKGTVMGVAWLNGELSASAAGADGPLGWSAGASISDPRRLGPALREAAKRLGFGGRGVALTLAHAQLFQPYIEMPPSSAATARRLVERHVDRHKTFSGAAVWQMTTPAPNETAHSGLVHVLPQELHDGLAAACRDAGLNLTRLIPVSELLEGLLPPSAASKPGQLLAVEIPHAIVLAVNRQPGVPLLRRMIPGSWANDAERILGEIRRTAIFVRQQHQLSVENIWIGGAEVSESEVARFAQEMSVGVGRLEIAGKSDEWAARALSLRAGGVNLVTREQREAKQRQAVSKLGRALGGLALLGAASVAVWAQQMRAQELADRARLERESARLERHLTDRRSAHRGMRLQRQVVASYDRASGAPVQAWVLGCVGSALPPGIVVTNLEVKRLEDSWRLELRGWTDLTEAPAAKRALETFSDRLSRGPLAVEFAQEESLAGSVPAIVKETVGLLRGRAAAPPPVAPRRPFFLEGSIR